MDGKETPITKYLANLERRKSLFIGQSSFATPSPPVCFPSLFSTRQAQTGTKMKINFDDTFFAEDENESILHISPPGHSSATKRRRTSLLFDDNENTEALQKKIGELERLLRQTQSELIDGRAAYTKLDQLNIENRRESNERVIVLEKSHEEMRLKCKNATERAESMEKQLLKLRRKDSESGREFHTQVTTQLNKISNLEDTVTRLQKENQELALKLTEESIEHEEIVQKLQVQLHSAETLSSKSSQEAEVSQGQLVETQNQLQKSQFELKEARMEAIKHDALKKEYDAMRNNQEASNTDTIMQLRKYENLFVREQLASKEKVNMIQKLKEENEILKTTLKREHLLQGQIMLAESEISVLKKQLRDKDAVEGERNNLKNEIKAWICVATKLDSSCRTPLSFDSLIRKNLDLLLEMKVENSNLKRTTESNSRQLTVTQAEVVQTKSQMNGMSIEIEKLTFNLKRVARLKHLIMQDRDGLRTLKESYEQEFEGLISEPLKARISQLETMIADYEVALSEDPTFRKPCQDCVQHTSTIESLKSQMGSLEEAKEELSRTIAEFNQTIAEDPTTGLKIVSFGNNPSMLSIEARLKECIAESDSLKEKLRGYEEDTMVAVPDAAVRQEKKELEDRLKVLERKHDLLRESYDYETVQLQNACTKLFGYYVTLSRGGGTENPNQFRIQSTYSTAPDETFILQEGTAGEMLLLDTPILAHFQDDIERFLRQECSVPAFLSAVTIAYTQGGQFSASTSHAEYNESVNQDQETIQVYPTESLPIGSSSTGREVQIEVEGEDSEKEDDDEERQDEDGGGETDEEDYDEEDEVDYDDERDDEPDEADEDDDDDVVMID